MATNFAQNDLFGELVEIHCQENATEPEQNFYQRNVYLPNAEKVDTLGRHLKPAENRHFYPLSTFFSLKQQKEEKEKERGGLRESFEQKVDTQETVDFDLSILDDFRDVGRFWQDALTHTRAEMRTRWPEYRGKVPDGLAGVIVSDVEASRAFREAANV